MQSPLFYRLIISFRRYSPSSLRQLSHSISDPKYANTRVSREDLEFSENGETENDAEDQGEDSDHLDEKDAHDNGKNVHTEPRPGFRGSSPDMNTLNKTLGHSAQQEPNASSDLASTLRATREQDRRKGKAVSRQIVSDHTGTFVSIDRYIHHLDDMGHAPRCTDTFTECTHCRQPPYFCMPRLLRYLCPVFHPYSADRTP